MGIKRLLKLINENKESLCSAPRKIQGKVIVDGYGLLHELYEKNNLDWCHGGRYADQYRVTVDYFETLVSAGVKPIVVVDGGGCLVQHNDTVYRRNKDVKSIPTDLEEAHLNLKSSHLMPPMAREVFVSTLQEKKVELYVADGKATKTIVSLANFLHCPVLTNSTNYCVCGIVGGVILFNYVDMNTCEAPVYQQSRLVEFCKLRTPDLIYAIVAIMGDGSDTSVPNFYHGRVKRQIEAHVIGTNLHGRSQILNVADFIRIRKFSTFDAFREGLKTMEGWQWKGLLENCQKAKDTYDYSQVNTLSTDELLVSSSIKCSRPCDLPQYVLHGYRVGVFPVVALNALSLGKCVLDQTVGDQEQPSPVMLGRPVRQLIYGVASSLMNQKVKNVQEFFRSDRGTLCYEAHEIAPICNQELMITDTPSLDMKSRKELAIQALCQVLQCPEEKIAKMREMPSLTIVTLATYYWAQLLNKKGAIHNSEQLIKALLLNFFFDLSDPSAHRQEDIDESRFSDLNWMKVYHALMEWQSLYRDICNFNSMFDKPLEVISPCFLYDGPFIIYLALCPSPQIIDTFMGKLEPKKKELFVNMVDLIL